MKFFQNCHLQTVTIRPFLTDFSKSYILVGADPYRVGRKPLISPLGILHLPRLWFLCLRHDRTARHLASSLIHEVSAMKLKSLSVLGLLAAAPMAS
jgi:hypothetical protein